MKKVFYAAALTLSLFATSAFAGQDATQTKEKKKVYWVRNKKGAPATGTQNGNAANGGTQAGANATNGQSGASASDSNTNGSTNMASTRMRRHHQKK